MRRKKVGICNWCSKGGVLKKFSYKCGEILIYNALFYIFKPIFIIFLPYKKLIKKIKKNR